MSRLTSIFMAIFFLTLSTSTYASFYNENSHEILTGVLTETNAICLANVSPLNEIKMLTHFSVNKSEMRKALRSLTYKETLVSEAKAAGTSVAISTSFAESTAGMSYFWTPFLYKYQSVKESMDSSENPSWIASFVPVLGERIVRGKRLDQLLSKDAYKVSNRVFNFIVSNSYDLKTTDDQCDKNLFSV